MVLQLSGASKSYEFDATTGKLIRAKWQNGELFFDGIRFDIGCDEKNLTAFLKYNSLLENRTWVLPEIVSDEATFPSFNVCINSDSQALRVQYKLGDVVLELIYRLAEQDTLSVTARVYNNSTKSLYLNTLTLAPALAQISDVRFTFPANAPGGVYDVEKLQPRKAITAGLVNFAIHTETKNGNANVMFIDSIEKWGTGVWHDNINTYYTYSASLEADLNSFESLEVGTLYLQLCDTGSPYLQIRSFVEALGYSPVTDGIHSGVMYSGHPYGTMDGDFTSLKQNLYEYAEYLPALREMGVDHMWVLPVFDHGVNGVYHSTDQAIIDERYGGDDATRKYCDKAHALGMTILFDYVPHGPVPEHPIAQNNPDWCAKRRDGSWQNEWDCVSMDYNHPGYQRYTTNLVLDHVNRFGIDGARIDCAMGGLSNWRPYADNRASASSVKAGVNISAAIRRGFIEGNKKPLNMPENFNPVPPYYSCTDLFYGMTLYRMLVELESMFYNNPSAFTTELVSWLEREKETLPDNLAKLRFLGNHDTVSWVWQARRATAIYGVEGAKAMWALISLIDGVPMVYQGDEDPVQCAGSGPRLYDFFKALFADRRKYVADSNAIRYIHTGTPIAAFVRGEKENTLVLVNLSGEDQCFDTDVLYKHAALAAGNANAKGRYIALAAYSYAIAILS